MEEEERPFERSARAGLRDLDIQVPVAKVDVLSMQRLIADVLKGTRHYEAGPYELGTPVELLQDSLLRVRVIGQPPIVRGEWGGRSDLTLAGVALPVERESAHQVMKQPPAQSNVCLVSVLSSVLQPIPARQRSESRGVFANRRAFPLTRRSESIFGDQVVERAKDSPRWFSTAITPRNTFLKQTPKQGQCQGGDTHF